ncbi:hypothetical protein [Cellulomonas sp. ATA003]|uniref:hypothetical protein n=1 Tax=Cellulomonas sp. ATA003 TaxID=3073064 RepID=UPI00287383C2|nr:hypothetical protein [Cellulomonas sp. ATA003]WNB85915.1 hypothetical protein REH70_00890 [Cellulomonas sp. ATA003]
MSTVLHPVGPQRARVYWIRRLLVVLLVVALVVGSASLVSWLRGDRGGDAGAAAATEQQADVDATSGDDGEAGAADDAGAVDDAADGEDGGEDDAPATPVDCTPAALQLTLTAADVEVAPTANPVLTATVTNVGDLPCTVDAGDAAREVVVTSGEDRVWSTKDCAPDDRASRQLLLAAGAADSVPIEWARVRSAEGCPADLPAPRAGTYQAVATLGAATSQTVVFILE